MTIRKVINGDLRAYIYWNNRWCHVYIAGSYDQTTILGTQVRMIFFKLTKASKDILSAEKAKFSKKKPATRSQKRGVAA